MKTKNADIRPEMEPLAFLLGKWAGTTVVYPANGSGEPEQGTISGDVCVALGGAWFEWDYLHRPDISKPLVRRARYSFGYSPGRGCLMAIYADDRGNALTEYAESDSFDGGHLAFRGSMNLPGKGEVGFVDDFTVPGDDSFRNTVTMIIHNDRHLHGIMDLTRIDS